VRAELRAQSRRPSSLAWRNALDAELVALLAEGRREDARLRLIERLGVAACR